MASAGKSSQKDLDDILEVLSNDSVTRAAVIRALARDHSSDFLAPVQIGSDIRGSLISDKEWQE